MILFFRSKANMIYAVGMAQPLQNSDIQKLTWLFSEAEPLTKKQWKEISLARERK